MIEIILMLSMAFFLFLSAWFDANGRDVPDPCTVPYAILGIVMAALQGRYMQTCLASVLLVSIIQHYRPKWILDMSERAMERAYSRQGNREQEEEEQERRAAAFYEKYASRVDNVLSVAYIVVPVLISIAAFVGGNITAQFLPLLIAVGGFMIYKRYLNAMSDVPEEEHTAEQIYAMGEADIIIAIGTIAFYGFGLKMLCGLLVTLIASLVWTLWKRIVTGAAPVGAPLIPFFALCMPLRLLIAIILPF